MKDTRREEGVRQTGETGRANAITEGVIWKQLLLFFFPILIGTFFQQLYNTADAVVVGRFVGKEALAAVGGSTSMLTNLLVGFFVGLSSGATVIIAQFYGAGRAQRVSEAVHTAIAFSLLCGILMTVGGLLFSDTALRLMGTPEDIMDNASGYLHIYFVGITANLLYNMGAGILRAIGDSKRPLYFLTLAGIINVIFNLIFVIVFHLGVAGVAISTAMSECISAILVMRCLIQADGVLKLSKDKLHFHKDKLIKMLKIGLPAGLQGMVFNISNVLIQSSVNSFGSIIVAGNTSASNIEGFVYTAMNSIYQTSLSFTSQNMGAKNYSRVNQILVRCLAVVSVIGFVLGFGAYLLGNILLTIYSTDPQVISSGLIRLSIVSASYFLCGIMDVIVGSLRGMGYSMMPMLISLTGACLFRVIWIFTIFQMNHSLFILYVSYPISWILTLTAQLICYFKVRKHAFV